MQDVLEIREALEELSVQVACDKITDEEIAGLLCSENEALMQAVKKLERDLQEMPAGELAASQKMAHAVVPDMEEIRRRADFMETLCSADYWPYPTYTDLLYSVK